MKRKVNRLSLCNKRIIYPLKGCASHCVTSHPFTSSATNIFDFMPVIQPAFSLKTHSWKEAPSSANLVQQLCQKLGLSGFLARLAASNHTSLEEAADFLDPRLKTHLPPFKNLPDIEKACHTLANALLEKQSIALWGDYDVDGATSSALWIQFLRWAGHEPRLYIPDRFKEGYGPNKEGIQKLANENIKLIITLDCGTTAFEPLEEARRLGIDVVVIDHHQSEETLPPCNALVNPNRFDALKEAEPFKILAAVGVSFFVTMALHQHLLGLKQGPWASFGPFDMRLLLDLVALGTVCDVVPLKGVNRLFVKQGLKIAQKGFRPGFVHLCDPKKGYDALSSKDLGFTIGPQLNAGGRLSDSRLAAQCLSTKDPLQAKHLAQTLNTLNIRRKMIQREVEEEAFLQAEDQKEAGCLILSSTNWHEGVIGIVASRIKDAYNKPTFVLAFDERGMGKGSGRSVKGIDLSQLIHAALSKKLIVAGGGHAMAGGVTLQESQLPDFEAFCQSYLSTLEPAPLEPRLFYGLLTFQSLKSDYLKDLERWGPFGASHKEPCFLFKNVCIETIRHFGSGHLSLQLSQADGGRASAVIFSHHKDPFKAFFKKQYTPTFHLIATLSWNSFEQKVSLQCEDILMPGAFDTCEIENNPSDDTHLSNTLIA